MARPPAPTEGRTEPVAADVVINLVDGIVLVDRSLAVVLMNPAAERIAGTSEVRARGLPVEQVLCASPVLPHLLAHAARTQGSAADRGVELRRPDGSTVPVEIVVSPAFESAHHEVTGMVITLRDRTPVQAIEEEARRVNRLQVAAALGMGLAHEVRNPLGGIRGAAQLLERRARDRPDLEECVAVILREVDRLDALVGSVLELGRGQPVSRGIVNVHRLLDETLELIRRDPRVSGVRLRTRFDPSLPEISGDGAALARCFSNLLLNAVDAVDGQGEVVVTTAYAKDFSRIRRAGGATRFLKVEVRDTGPGIAPDLLERVFTPLYTTKARGTGLGLPISLKIVEDHGGFLRAVVPEDGGACFEVYLPLPDAAPGQRGRRRAS